MHRLLYLTGVMLLVAGVMRAPAASASPPRPVQPRPSAPPSAAVPAAPSPTTAATAPVAATWLTDYAAAGDQADRQGKMLLIHFHNPADPQSQRFQNESLQAADVQPRLANYVCLRLPLDAAIRSEGREIRLLDDPSFQEMLGRPGLAIIDYTRRDSPHYGQVVSTFPLSVTHWYTPRHVATMLDLPPGSLTQRTMIYAVRVHPEQPASTQGRVDPYLLSEAESHCCHQAAIRVQGHHNWGSRFQRILGRMPGGLMPAEVCAESWPGQRLVDAAVECVRCWRLSSGHWRAVSNYQPLYAYDIKLGSNGIWYATGVFGEGAAAMRR